MFNRRRVLYLIPFVLLIASNANCQPSNNSVSGYVKDSSTGEPLAGVNVFLSGTYWGASTGSDGRYLIESIIPGNYEIVVSMVGYTPMYDQIKVEETRHTRADYFLKQRIYEIEDVTVEAEVPEEWFDQLDLFKKYFLGSRDCIYDCIIENETELNFAEDDEMFYASCKNPLTVYNYALGYKIDCILFKFEYNKNTGGCNYIIKPMFTEMEYRDTDELEYWTENR